MSMVCLRKLTFLFLVSVCLVLNGCALAEKYGPHPLQMAAGATVETIAFGYRSMAEGDVKNIEFEGPQITSSESIPCFDSPDSVGIRYDFHLFSGKRFEEKVYWRRGAYVAVTEREVTVGRHKATFPTEQVVADLGINWPGLWSAELQVKGETRGRVEFRLASKKTRDKLLKEADAMRAREDREIYRRLVERAEACWPDCIREN